ncbi:class 1 isoprenoid biosynthesis enzyme [Actinokineospora spheciospongiae]|uniref:class 1 isoprenoid biosynthesis enzyme n=1 Tax=Actinokineospora spheciospongiae TaxID=909613 RepID=UPI000D901F4F|nr:class 1 isoprenoid biosynthesis enzyme [Actinokineospora spheciospongiae]PWW66695.1 hypothetical protein DFQ13_101211 [Actinokineospora spheciospongiae]
MGRTEGSLRDLWSLVRHVRWARPTPGIRRRAVEYLAVFERVVVPVVTAAVDDPVVRERVVDALRGPGVKLTFLAAAYAETAGLPLDVEPTVLTGAITRVYDDLFDHFGGPDLDNRLDSLFRTGDFAAANDVEAVFAGLYRAVRERVDPAALELLLGELLELQAYQVRSREQTDPSVGFSSVLDITRGKGGHGMVVLFGVATGPLHWRESALVRELGSVLQLLDDYEDMEPDRAAGVRTAVTLGGISLGGICAGLREVADGFGARFGRRRPMFTIVYAALWMSYLRRRFPRPGGRSPVARHPLSTLLLHPAPLASPDLRLSPRPARGKV